MALKSNDLGCLLLTVFILPAELGELSASAEKLGLALLTQDVCLAELGELTLQSVDFARLLLDVVARTQQIDGVGVGGTGCRDQSAIVIDSAFTASGRSGVLQENLGGITYQ